MEEFCHVMALPCLACVILVASHAYLGFHVIERQVIFVDLALAQLAVLGSAVALVMGHPLEAVQSYWFSFGFTMTGAALFAFLRFQEERVPQEALIGIVYAVSAAALILLLSRSGEGDEHIKQALVGNILLVSKADVGRLTLIYSVLGTVHWLFRKPLLAVSRDPQGAVARGIKVRWWDFVFYLTLGIAVTNSVKIAGVLLVFSYLVVPPVCAMLIARTLPLRLLAGWCVGLGASILGMAFSYYGDFPTGASVVCMLGASLAGIAVVRCFRCP